MTKFDPHLFFNPVWEKNFDPPTSSLDPPPTKNLDPHLHFDNSNTVYMYVMTMIMRRRLIYLKEFFLFKSILIAIMYNASSQILNIAPFRNFTTLGVTIVKLDIQISRCVLVFVLRGLHSCRLVRVFSL